MSVIYVKEQGSYIRKSGERIEVIKNNQNLLSFPIANLDGLTIIGNVQISTQSMVYMMKNGVDISIFSFSGEFIGQALADSSKNIFLRFSQYDLYQDMEKRLDLAKIIVKNKIKNQMFLVKNYRYKDNYSPKEELIKMQRLKEKTDVCETSNEILGMEGMCSNYYFSCFAHMVQCRIPFKGRNRRPPKDPVNVILSLAYTFLTREVCGALEAESFEVYLGFLHGIRYGRKSLALDMVEEFRQPVVDRFVIHCFNRRIINEYDFEIEEGRILLNEDGFRKFCTEYEKWMCKASINGKSFRQIIRKQMVELKKAIQYGNAYLPFDWGERYETCNKL